MVVEIKKVKEIKDLPENEILEEVRIYYAPSNNLLKRNQDGKRQEVLFFAKRIGNNLFSTDKKGDVLRKEDFQNIEWITYLVRK